MMNMGLKKRLVDLLSIGIIAGIAGAYAPDAGWYFDSRPSGRISDCVTLSGSFPHKRRGLVFNEARQADYGVDGRLRRRRYDCIYCTG